MRGEEEAKVEQKKKVNKEKVGSAAEICTTLGLVIFFFWRGLKLVATATNFLDGILIRLRLLFSSIGTSVIGR